MVIRLLEPSNNPREMSHVFVYSGRCKGMQTTREKKRRSRQGGALFCSQNYYFRIPNYRQCTNTQQFSFIKGSILNQRNLYNYFKIGLRQKCVFNNQMIKLKRSSWKKNLVESKPNGDLLYLHS